MHLDKKQDDMLSGGCGEAARLAMSIIVRMAAALEVGDLIVISQAHIDGCGLLSDSSVEFAELLARLGGKVSVPTTLNMIPLDLQNWRKQGVPEEFAAKAERMAKAYVEMGCIPTWTCAPYQAYLAPRFGQQIAWGESNAIAYANSVLGARTERYADFLDICAAITGCVPRYGLHLESNRKGRILFRLVDINPAFFADDSFYPVLGHLVGQMAQDQVPVIAGLDAPISSDQFKAFGAAAASAGAVGLYHIIGQTPEAPSLEAAFQGSPPERTVEIHYADLLAACADLSTVPGEGARLDAVILGCPHFSYLEFSRLARLIQAGGLQLHPGVRFIILTGQASYVLLGRGGLLEPLAAFGAEIVLDTCVFHSPIVAAGARLVMTNSGKCAYYAPGTLDVQVVFGSLEDCLRSAVSGFVAREAKLWKSA